MAETKLHLDVFEPEGLKASDKRPAIVFFFGGGWARGDPKQFHQQAEELSKRGNDSNANGHLINAMAKRWMAKR